MARSASPRAKAGRSLLGLLAIVLVLLGLGGLGVALSPAERFEDKVTTLVPRLGLDLEGGTQIILRPTTESGSAPTEEQLEQSVAIIRQRVNAAGITEANVTTSGASNLIVSIPGTPSDETLNSVRASARMDFRAVLATTAAATTSVGEEGEAYTPPASLQATPSVAPTDGSDLNQITPYLADLYENYSCTQGATPADPDRPAAEQPVVMCDPDGLQKFLLGPIEVPGTNIADATNGLVTNSQGVSTGTWAVNLNFNAEGARQFADVTTRLAPLTGAQNQFAIVLDDTVISAPGVNQAIVGSSRVDLQACKLEYSIVSPK